MSSPAQTEYPDKIDAAVLKIAGVVVLGAIMSILDITVVNVALPDLQTTFTGEGDPLPYSTVAWTVTAYTLALAAVVLTTGSLADRLGRKRVFTAGLVVFTITSALAAAATDITMLNVIRAVQGLGAAAPRRTISVRRRRRLRSSVADWSLPAQAARADIVAASSSAATSPTSVSPGRSPRSTA